MKSKTFSAILAATAVALLLAAPRIAVSAGTPSSRSAAPSEYNKAEEAIDVGNYRLALTHLNRALKDTPNNADVHNLLGYSHRKLGNTEKAFEHYDKALALEPKHRGANEYIGELYLETGQLAKAEERLKVLDDACFFGCEEYDELKEAIESYKAKIGG